MNFIWCPSPKTRSFFEVVLEISPKTRNTHNMSSIKTFENRVYEYEQRKSSKVIVLFLKIDYMLKRT